MKSVPMPTIKTINEIWAIWIKTHTVNRFKTVVLFDVFVHHQIVESVSTSSRRSRKQMCECVLVPMHLHMKHLKCSYSFGIFLRHTAQPQRVQCERKPSEWAIKRNGKRGIITAESSRRERRKKGKSVSQQCILLSKPVLNILLLHILVFLYIFYNSFWIGSYSSMPNAPNNTCCICFARTHTHRVHRSHGKCDRGGEASR